jgi:hypothetical protein
MRVHHWITIGVAAAGFAAALSFHSRPAPIGYVEQPVSTRAVRYPEQPFAMSPAASADDLIPAQGAALRFNAEAARARAEKAQSGPGAAAPAEIPNPDELRARMDADRAQAETRMRDHLATVAAGFAAEARDQRWSNDVGESIRHALSGEEFTGAGVQSVDCRTKTCRIEMQDDGTGKAASTIPMLAVQMAGALPNLIADRIEQSNGKAMIVLYLSR